MNTKMKIKKDILNENGHKNLKNMDLDADTLTETDMDMDMDMDTEMDIHVSFRFASQICSFDLERNRPSVSLRSEKNFASVSSLFSLQPENERRKQLLCSQSALEQQEGIDKFVKLLNNFKRRKLKKLLKLWASVQKVLIKTFSFIFHEVS